MIDLPDTGVILEPSSPAPFDDSLFDGCCAVLFVVDITDDYVNALTKLCALALRSKMVERNIPIEVLLHKADSMDEHDRQGRQLTYPFFIIDVLRDITQKVREEAMEICPDPPEINFHLTSIFDYTLYVALSRIIQNHIPEISALEALLDMLCNVQVKLVDCHVADVEFEN